MSYKNLLFGLSLLSSTSCAGTIINNVDPGNKQVRELAYYYCPVNNQGQLTTGTDRLNTITTTCEDTDQNGAIDTIYQTRQTSSQQIQSVCLSIYDNACQSEQ